MSIIFINNIDIKWESVIFKIQKIAEEEYMAIVNNILDLIGNTPLVKVNTLSKKTGTNIIAKLESFNPLSCVKERIALAMVNDAEKKGLLTPGGLIIEPTSGNTGIGLAFVAAAKGYRLILTMPESMSVERRKVLKALGAELVLTPAGEGMKGAINKAFELSKDNPGSFVPQQFQNPANPEVHKKTTGPEIWKDTEGKVDIFIAGIGTGGTITGVGEYLKEKNPEIQIIAVEPEESAVLSGESAGPHKIQGIGAGFIPEVLNTAVYDEVIKVKSTSAAETTRAIAKEEGIFVGISSGAALTAAQEIGQRPENKDKNIVVLLPDTGERYLSTWIFDYEG